MHFTCIAIISAIAATALAAPASDASSPVSLFARDSVNCNNLGGVNYNDAERCASYLIGLDTTPCTVGRGTGGFCAYGTAAVIGTNVGPGATATSFCRDVGYSVQAIINECSGSFTGTDTAGGNGNIQISLQRS